jgi:hypothetical protein
MKHLVKAAAAGSLLLLATREIDAGDVCKGLCSDQPSRPHVSAADAPNWGFHPTCWQRFPPVTPCPSGFEGGCQWSHAELHNAEGGAHFLPPSAQMMPAGVPQDDFMESGADAMSGTIAAPGGFDSQPVSVLPHGLSTGRYGSGVPAAPQLPGTVPPSGVALPLPPSTTAPALPPLPAPPAGAGARAIPPQDASGIRTFHATPTAAGRAMRGQAPANLPNQLMFAQDGRVHAVRAQPASMNSGLVATGSRYAAPINSVVQPAQMSATGSSRYGAMPQPHIRPGNSPQQRVRPVSAATTGGRYGR